MIKTTVFIDHMIQDITTCKDVAEKHWLTASTQARSWKDERFGWSINDILTHLTSFATHYLPIIKTQIELAQKNGSVPKINYSFTPELADFLNTLSYDKLEHMESVGHFAEIETKIAASYNTPQHNFIDIQNQLLYLLEVAKTVNIEDIQIPSLISNLDFKLGDCFQFLIRHQILHFAQADVIIEAYATNHLAME